MEKKATVYKEKATKIRLDYNDFDGTLEEWKKALYEVWRWQMTWDFAYTIKVREYRIGGVALILLIHPSFKKNVVEMLEDYGYRNPRIEDVDIGVVDFEWSEDFDIEDVFME